MWKTSGILQSQAVNCTGGIGKFILEVGWSSIKEGVESSTVKDGRGSDYTIESLLVKLPGHRSGVTVGVCYCPPLRFGSTYFEMRNKSGRHQRDRVAVMGDFS